MKKHIELKVGFIKKGLEVKEVTPKKNHHLLCPPHCNLELKEGKKCKVPVFLTSTLKTEKVL